MKKKGYVYLIILSVLVIGCVSTLGVMSIKHSEPDSISCSARLMTIRGETRADVMMSFNVNPGLLNGTVALSGEIRNGVNGAVENKLYRRTMFTYTKYDNYYRFTAQKIIPVASDEHITDISLLSILPVFFTQEGASVDWKVTQEGKQGYLFSVGKMPRFFCEL